MEKYRVGIVGATGMVGQRFISLLKDHPWFEVNCVAASARSAGKTYREAVGERWAFSWEIPEKVAGMTVVDAADIDEVSKHVDFVFCAVDMKKDESRALEEAYAKHEIPVVSNNSACRGIEDVPMVVPEINADHLAVIEAQKKRLGTKNGFIAVKPNCSIQSYVPALTPLLDFEPEKVSVCTYQAISGAGKTFKTWPEMVDNVIPYIGGEDEKSENEPLKLELAATDKQIANIIKAVTEGFAQASMAGKMTELEGRKAQIETRLLENQTKLKQDKITETDLRNLLGMFRQFVKERNIPEVKRFLASFVQKVIVHKDHVVVVFLFAHFAVYRSEGMTFSVNILRSKICGKAGTAA